ncbi:unnamed protein product [Moneuplotes crassus]|uniref:Uncharacterized protein n=1 Tax=Euplotes crassus TaxID=5936 RepID=A0AAD2D298_EUPCR|nr:unnamed protein product [Moneuplotes crassus]
MGSITETNPSNASLDQNPMGNSKKTKESDQHVDSIESDYLVIDEDNFGQYMNSVFKYTKISIAHLNYISECCRRTIDQKFKCCPERLIFSSSKCEYENCSYQIIE